MSLRKHAYSATTVSNTISMSRSLRFVIVEGETELRLLQNVLDGVHVKPAGDRDEVIRAVDTLLKRDSTNFLALIDADYKAALGRLEFSDKRTVYVSIDPNPINSQIDLESALFCSEALTKVCNEYLGSTFSSPAEGHQFAHRIREGIRKICAAVGAYRAARELHYYAGVRMGKIGDLERSTWNRFCNLDELELNQRRLQHCIEERIASPLHFRNLKKGADAILSEHGAGWLLCRGHDITELLAAHFSNLLPRRVERPEVERSLRLAFEKTMLPDVAFGRALLSAPLIARPNLASSANG